MEIFRCINKIEDGVRRSKVVKEETEKMGVPMVMGSGKEPRKLTQDVVSGGEDILEPDESTDSEKCKCAGECACDEECKELLDALHFMKTAEQGGVRPFVPTEDRVEKISPRVDPDYDPDAKKKPGAKPKPAQFMGDPGPAARKKGAGKKAASRKKAKAATKKKDVKVSAKKAGKKAAKGEGKKGSSGLGSGAAGRTGTRKRRAVGEFWTGPSGFHTKTAAKTALWTKRKDGSIVRVGGKEAKGFKDRKRAEGKDWREGDAGEEDEHKKRTEFVQHWEEAKSRNLRQHLTDDSHAAMLQEMKAMGIELSAKELKLLQNELVHHRLSRGAWNPRRSPTELKRDFVDGMDPNNYGSHDEFNKVKQRVESMTPQQFEVLMAVIALDEEDDALRDKYSIERMSPKVHSKLSGGAAKSFDDQLEDIVKALC